MFFTVLIILNILSIIVLAYWLVVYIKEFKKLPKLAYEDVSSPIEISIIMPVRNEESRIEKSLSSVLKQNNVVSQIIIVDDSSIDRTRSIVEEYSKRYRNIELIEADGRPLDSIGKSWPSYLGYTKAKHDYLLFLDADTVLLDEEILAKSVRTLEKLRLDYISLFPSFELSTVWARLTYPLYINTVVLFERFSKINRDNSSKCFLIGAFSLFRKRVYEIVGGHMSVINEIVEDKVLGEKLRALGFNFRLFNGSGIVKSSVEAGIKDVWYSVVRFISGLRNKSKVTIFLLFFYVIVFLIPLISAFTMLGSFSITWIPSILLSIVLNGLELSRNKQNLIYALGYPLAVLLLISTLLYVLVSLLRGKIEFKWKDRRYIVKV
mgnify:CR=1 FL=1